MPTYLYVEPGDEITDLVDRLRRAGDATELVFVVPEGARVLRTPLDLQLLQQYARGFGKSATIVAGDPRVQRLAVRAGFAAYGSLPALGQGPPAQAAAVAAAAVAATPAPAPPPGATVPPGAAGPPAAPPRPGGAGAAGELVGGAEAAAGPAASGRSRGEAPARRGRRLRSVAIGAGALVFLAGILAVLFLLPSATVVVVVRATAVHDAVTLQGTTSPGQATVLDSVATQSLQTPTEQAQYRATPTGTRHLPGVAATGHETLASDEPVPLQIVLQPGTRFSTGGAHPVVFTVATAQTVVIPACSGACGNGQYGPPSQPFPVAAAQVGSAGNVAPGAITTWVDNPCLASPPPAQCAIFSPPLSGSSFSAANPEATVGGEDPRKETIFTGHDLAVVRLTDHQLTRRLEARVRRDLAAAAGTTLTMASGPSGQGIAVTVTQPTYPLIGTVGVPETLSITAIGAATAYSPLAAQRAALRDLLSKIPADGELLGRPRVSLPTVVQAAPGGSLTLEATVTGSWAPHLDLGPYAGDLVLKSPAAARSFLIGQVASAAAVLIHQSPFGLPWLPLLRSRIHVTRLARAAAGGAPA
ncbi:MAG TPA: hypothetical protein VNN74_04410 [Candidatus Micrarchaeia archaeon]|nr:hypothetical protein [Candidatus Micrarchaeia archaeon]